MIKQSKEKNLIIAPVGDNSYHKTWLKGGKRNFDIMLIYFGAKENRYIEDADYYLCIKDRFKFENIKAAADKNIHIIKTYGSIWLPDDDMITNPESINKLFEIFYSYNLDLAQPALKGKVDHPITREEPSCILR